MNCFHLRYVTQLTGKMNHIRAYRTFCSVALLWCSISAVLMCIDYRNHHVENSYVDSYDKRDVLSLSSDTDYDTNEKMKYENIQIRTNKTSKYRKYSNMLLPASKAQSNRYLHISNEQVTNNTLDAKRTDVKTNSNSKPAIGNSLYCPCCKGAKYESIFAVNGSVNIESCVCNKTFFHRDVVNPHYTKYIYTNAHTCEKTNIFDRDVFVVLLILTAPKERLRRDNIRATWGHLTQKPIYGKRVAYIFLLAKSFDKSEEAGLARENAQYHDICKEDFIDSYDNLTLKTLMGLRWASNFCKEAKFVLKIDSDMIPNLPTLVDHLKTSSDRRLVEGRLLSKQPPYRNVDGFEKKWNIPLSVYPYSIYPPYVDGPAYLISSDLLPLMLEMSQHVEYFKIEDIYIAMVLNVIGVAPRHSKQYTMMTPSRSVKKVKKKKIVADEEEPMCLFSFAITAKSPLLLKSFWTRWQQFNTAKCSITADDLCYWGRCP